MLTERTQVTVTIASGGSDSTAINCSGGSVKRIHVPASTQGASIILLHSPTTSGTFASAQHPGGWLRAIPLNTVPCAIELPPEDYAGSNSVKIRTCSDQFGAVAQSQSADRTFTVVVVE